MKTDKIKISQMPATDNLDGFSTIGSDSGGNSYRAGLGFMKDAVGPVLDTAGHPATVGEDKYVYTWDKEAQRYVRTGICVIGDRGRSAYGHYLEGGGDPAVTEEGFGVMLANLSGLIEPKNLANLPVGYNMRGRTVVFERQDLRPATSASVKSLDFGPEVRVYFSAFGILTAGIPSVTIAIYNNLTKLWNKSTLSFPDDTDYIVTANTLPAHSGTYWGFDYTTIK